MERDLYKQIKTSKKQNLNLKTVRNKGTSKLQPISLVSYFSKKKKKKKKKKTAVNQ